MAEKKWTTAAVKSKVEWEGGILDTLYWGLMSNDIEDGPLKELWAKLEQAEPIFNAINRILDETPYSTEED